MADLDSIKILIRTHRSGLYPPKVTKEQFVDFPMFDKITFKDNDGLPFVNFFIITNGKKYTYGRELRRFSGIINISILQVEVFVFSENVNNPLLVRVNSRDNYYCHKISESQKREDFLKLDQGYSYSSTELFEALIDENEKINNKITFRIDKTINYNGITISSDITISNDITINNGTLSGFSTYTHVPKNDYQHRKPVVLRGRNRVLEPRTLEFIHDKNFEKMTVYYRDGVKYFEIPLLIEFIHDGKKYYFQRNNIYEKNWTAIEIEKNQLRETLENIEIRLLFCVSVSIDKKTNYTNGVIKDDIYSNGLDHSNNEQIKVNEYTKCLIEDYVCYVHDLSKYIGEGFKQKIRKFGEHFKLLFVNISNTLIETTDGESESPVFFVETNPKFYVWFYRGDKKLHEDNLPLMISYYNRVYVPKSKEEYLDKWVIFKSSIDLERIQKTELDIIKNELDRVNLMLNTIDLNHNVVNTGEISKYGIPKPTYLNTSFDTTRINVGSESYDHFLFKCIHSTKNGFMIGRADYTKQIYHQRGTEQKHQRYSKSSKKERKTCGFQVKSREVSVYYFKYDPDSEYPLTLECRIRDGYYEYYVLRCDFSENSEYEFRCLTVGSKIDDNDLRTIITHQNFIFHNVINIKLDKRSAYTCCDKLIHNKHLTFARSKVRGLESCRFNYENNRDTKNLPFIEVAEFHTKLLYGYIVYEHSLTTFSTTKATLGNTYDDIKIKGFRINNSEITFIGSPLQGGIFVKAPHVYVYFYRLDPRPLLVCYNYKAYSPKDETTYDKNWYPVESVKNFIFKSQREFNSLDPELLVKLHDTVGFLNKVNLYEHKPDSNYTYNVHTYNGQDVKINVKSRNVRSSPPSSSISCYKKITHTPHGINGSDSHGFRLGNIEYRGNNLTGKLDYLKGDNKWDPLTSVSVYYYKYDNEYKDPLLVELQFEKSVALRKAILIEYYKLKTRDGNKLEWEKDLRAFHDVKRGGNDLINHLDSIRFNLKKVLKIELANQSSYDLMLSQNVGEANQFKKENGYQVKVEPCESCPTISNEDYRKFVHRISTINGSFDYNLIGGIKFTLPGTNEKPIEILLNDSDGSKSIGSLSYNKCMGDVHVYFSKHSDKNDPVPLFIHFYNQWYTPSSIGGYFKTWSTVDERGVISKLNELGGHIKIEECINKLKMVNQLNGSGVYNIELARSGSSEVSEIHTVNDLDMPSGNYLEIPPDDDFEIFSVQKAIPSIGYSEDSYVDTEIPSDNEKETPCVDLEIPYDIYMKNAYVDLKRHYVSDLENSYINGLEKVSDNVFKPKSLDVGSHKYLEGASIQGDQSQPGIYKVLNTSQDFNPEVKIGEVSPKALEVKKSSKDDLVEIPVSAALSSTGQHHDSDESNQSYLGSILGGTFGSLITIGLFTFMLFKYFRRVKIRNMIPNLY